MKVNPYKRRRSYRPRRRKVSLLGRIRFRFKARKDSDEYAMPKGVFEEKAVYLDTYRTKQRPAWVLPVVLAFGILLVVFWTGPYILGFLSGLVSTGTKQGEEAVLLYDSPEYAVVDRQSADLLLDPDLRSRRISQVLFNDLVRIIGRDTYGYVQVRLQDGTEGYLMSSDVSVGTRSVEPNLHSHKLTVTAKSKRIMSHASKGSLLLEVYMGSVLFSDYQGDGIYRISLPGDAYGWISSEGIIRTETDEDPAVSNARKFYETALSFVNVTYIENGLTSYGASSSGIAYICARINGVDIPRDMLMQSRSGTEVVLRYDEESGLPAFSDYVVGDLVFFRNELADPEGISSMGIVVGEGQLLMSVRSENSVRIVALPGKTDLLKSIVTVRRLFAGP